MVSDGWPVLCQVTREVVDSHSIDARTTFIGLHPPYCFLQIDSLAHFLHQSIRAGWAFGAMCRRKRFGLFLFRFAGFTRWQGQEVQCSLRVRPPVVSEVHVLLASPLVQAFSHRSRLGLSAATPLPQLECVTRLADTRTYYAL